MIPTADICQENHTVYTDTHGIRMSSSRNASYTTLTSCSTSVLTQPKHSHTSAAWFLPPHILNNKSREVAAAVGATSAVTLTAHQRTRHIQDKKSYRSTAGSQRCNLHVLHCRSLLLIVIVFIFVWTQHQQIYRRDILGCLEPQLKLLLMWRGCSLLDSLFYYLKTEQRSWSR